MVCSLCLLKSIIRKLDCREFDNRKTSIIANDNFGPENKLDYIDFR